MKCSRVFWMEDVVFGIKDGKIGGFVGTDKDIFTATPHSITQALSTTTITTLTTSTNTTTTTTMSFNVFFHPFFQIL